MDEPVKFFCRFTESTAGATGSANECQSLGEHKTDDFRIPPTLDTNRIGKLVLPPNVPGKKLSQGINIWATRDPPLKLSTGRIFQPLH
jgi:hypothetical protein